jgi:hypothetical protein
MKWMLLVFAFGTSMVRTGLAYDNLDDCVKAEQTMRSEYVRVYNQWLEWAIANPKQASYPKSQPLMQKRIGLQTIGTCVPTTAIRKDEVPAEDARQP